MLSAVATAAAAAAPSVGDQREPTTLLSAFDPSGTYCCTFSGVAVLFLRHAWRPNYCVYLRPAGGVARLPGFASQCCPETNRRWL